MQQQKTILTTNQPPKTSQDHIHYTHTIFVQLLEKLSKTYYLRFVRRLDRLLLRRVRFLFLRRFLLRVGRRFLFLRLVLLRPPRIMSCAGGAGAPGGLGGGFGFFGGGCGDALVPLGRGRLVDCVAWCPSSMDAPAPVSSSSPSSSDDEASSPPSPPSSNAPSE